MGVVCSSTKSTRSSRKTKNPIISKGDEIMLNSNFSHKRENNSNINQDDIYEKLLKQHNDERKRYNAHELELNYELCQLAQEYADKCADSQNIDFTPVLYNDECIGENISEFYGDISTTSKICEDWAYERNYFDFRSKEYKDQTKHFTQMIWKNTKSVGFGFSSSSNGKYYFVSFYYPAGNIFDEFDKNV